jgi:hypothetical protein
LPHPRFVVRPHDPARRPSVVVSRALGHPFPHRDGLFALKGATLDKGKEVLILQKWIYLFLE